MQQIFLTLPTRCWKWFKKIKESWHNIWLQLIKPASRTINTATEQNSHSNECIENEKETENNPHEYNTSSDSKNEQHNFNKEHL